MGRAIDSPPLTRLLGYVRTRGKRHSEGQKSMKLFRQVTRGHQRSNLTYLNIFDNLTHNSRTSRATAPRKSAFDSSSNALSKLSLRFDLRSTVLPPESKNSKKKRFYENGPFYHTSHGQPHCIEVRSLYIWDCVASRCFIPFLTCWRWVGIAWSLFGIAQIYVDVNMKAMFGHRAKHSRPSTSRLTGLTNGEVGPRLHWITRTGVYPSRLMLAVIHVWWSRTISSWVTGVSRHSRIAFR